MKLYLIFAFAVFCSAASAKEIDLTCDLCHFVVNECDSYLSENMTVAQITTAVEKACDILPIGADMCRTIVEQYAPQMVQMLVDKADPSVICQSLGLCSKTDVPLRVDLGCELCHFVVSKVDAFLTSGKTESEIVSLVEHACDILPVGKEMCAALVESKLPEVIELLAQKADPSLVCKTIGLCEELELTKPVAVEEPQAELDLGCELCGFVVGEVDKYLTEGKTEEQIVTLVEKACDILPIGASLCKSVVESKTPEIIQMLVDKADPSVICHAIGLCKEDHFEVQLNIGCELCGFVVGEVDKYLTEGKTEEQIVALVDHACDILPLGASLCKSIVESKTPEIIQMLVDKADPSVVCHAIGLCKDEEKVEETKLDLGCALCDFVVGKVDQFLTEGKTEEQIVTLVEKACDVLPVGASLCKSVVESKGPEIIEMLVNKADPSVVCHTLGLCKDEEEEAQLNLGCELCDFVVAKVDAYLTEGKTEEQIVTLVEKACDILPLGASLCKSIVEAKTPEIIELLVNKADPSVVCHAIGLCKDEEEKAQLDLGCELCGFVVGEVDKYLTEGKTEEQIVTLVEKACDILPIGASLCKSIVESKTPEIIQMLVDKADPSVVCHSIGLCKDQAKEVEVDVEIDLGCDMCNFVVGEVDQYLSAGKTQDQIISLVEQACDILPIGASLCKSIVESKTPEIIQMLVDKADPSVICAAIGLCKSEEQAQLDLGCELCGFVVGEVDKYLLEGKTEDQIVTLVEKACDILPVGASLCKSIVESKTPEIIQMLVDKADPSVVCHSIGLCKDKVEVSIDVPCELCQFIVKTADQYLTAGKTEDQIVSLLEKACSKLPIGAGQCTTMVDQHAAEVIEMLAEKASPDAVCEKLSLCKEDLMFFEVFTS